MRVGEPDSAVPDEMFTILPYRCSRIAGSTARQAKKTPRRLTAITRSHSSTVISSIVPRALGNRPCRCRGPPPATMATQRASRSGMHARRGTDGHAHTAEPGDARLDHLAVVDLAHALRCA